MRPVIMSLWLIVSSVSTGYSEDLKMIGPPAPHTDRHGDALPTGAIARLGNTRLRHSGTVMALAFAPDGKTLASMGHDHTVRLWDNKTGKEIHRLPVDERSAGRYQFNGLGFAADGKTLAAVFENSSTYLWDPVSGKVTARHTANFERNPSGLFLSRDLKTIVGASYDGDIFVHDTLSGRKLARYRSHASDGLEANVVGPRHGQDYVRPLALSPDGKWLVVIESGSEDLPKDLSGQVRKKEEIWLRESVSGKKIRQLIGANEDWWPYAAFSPDGKMVAITGYGKVLGIWDADTGRVLHRLDHKSSGVPTLRFSADSRILAGGCGTILELWDTGTGKSMRRLQPHPWMIFSVAFSPDGKTVAVGTAGNTIHLWNIESGTEILPHDGHLMPINSVAFLGRDNKVISAAMDNQAMIWSLESTKVIRTVTDKEIRSVIVSPDGSTIAALGTERSIFLWNPDTGAKTREIPADKDREFVDVAFSADGKTLVSLDWTKWLTDDVVALCHWNPLTGQRLRRKSFSMPSGQKHLLGISWDGKYLIIKEATDGIRLGDFGVAFYDFYLWNPLTSERLTLKQQERYKDFACMALSADSRFWATGDSVERYLVQRKGAAEPVQERVGGTLQLWDTATGKKRRDVGPANGYSALAFSHDGKLLAGAVEEDHVICVWNVSNGKERCRFDSGPGKVTSLAFSHSGALLVSAQPDNTLLVWGVAAASSNKE